MSLIGYTKLFSSILGSTIWSEDHATVRVWITMLAMADADGEVCATVPGLANLARVTLEECKLAIDKFMKPDEYSRTKAHEGRRIVELPEGGWALLNHAKYRAAMSRDDKREKDRERQRRYRKKQNVTAGVTDGDDLSRLSRQAEEEAQSKEHTQAGRKKPRAPDPEPPADPREFSDELTDQEVQLAFRGLYLTARGVEPGMGGKHASSFPERLRSTARARGEKARDVLRMAFERWAKDGFEGASKFGGYAAFVARFEELVLGKQKQAGSDGLDPSLRIVPRAAQ